MPPDPLEVPGDASEDSRLVEIGASRSPAHSAYDVGPHLRPAPVPAVQGAAAVTCMCHVIAMPITKIETDSMHLGTSRFRPSRSCTLCPGPPEY